MDLELKGYLKAMEQRLVSQIQAGDAETRRSLQGTMSAMAAQIKAAIGARKVEVDIALRGIERLEGTTLRLQRRVRLLERRVR